MRSLLILAAAAMLGLAGGYGWSAFSSPHALPRVPKSMGKGPHTIYEPAAPDGAADREWASRADDSAAAPQPRSSQAAAEASVTYAGCNQVRAAGKAPLYAGQPGYRSDMDGDGDGIACEPHPGV